MKKNKTNILVLTVVVGIAALLIGYTTFFVDVDTNTIKTSLIQLWSTEITSISTVETRGEGKGLQYEVVDDNTVLLKSSLKNKNDLVTYTINLKNAGNVDSIISEIKLTESNSSSLNYFIDNIQEQEVIKKKDSKTFTVTIKCEEDQEQEIESDIQLTVNFEKKID